MIDRASLESSVRKQVTNPMSAETVPSRKVHVSIVGKKDIERMNVQMLRSVIIVEKWDTRRLNVDYSME